MSASVGGASSMNFQYPIPPRSQSSNPQQSADRTALVEANVAQNEEQLYEQVTLSQSQDSQPTAADAAKAMYSPTRGPGTNPLQDAGPQEKTMLIEAQAAENEMELYQQVSTSQAQYQQQPDGGSSASYSATGQMVNVMA